MTENPKDPLFPTLTPGGPDSKRSNYPTRWFGELRTALRIKDGVGFHSFRHNVNSRLIKAGVPLPAVARIAGRTLEGGGEAGNRYFKMTVTEADEYLNRLAYPEIDLSHLYVSQPRNI